MKVVYLRVDKYVEKISIWLFDMAEALIYTNDTTKKYRKINKK